MNGILNILKPPGMTSFDVVGFLRGVLKIKKIGHTGTLDPDAVGVLPICIGHATRAIEYITDRSKLYRAEMTLGIETDTQDASGNILGRREINAGVEEITQTIMSFLGKYMQVPPMYSAVKIDGRKLYELAREGRTVEREPREVEILDLSIKKISGFEDGSQPRKRTPIPPGNVKVLFDIACSKGTYIRTLCHDIGQRLGCGAHMSFLERLKVGSFSVDQALTLEEVDHYAREGILNSKILPVDKVFAELPEKRLEENEARKFLNGVLVPLKEMDGALVPLKEMNGALVPLKERSLQPDGLVRVYASDGTFLALGEVINRDGKTALKSKKLFLS